MNCGLKVDLQCLNKSSTLFTEIFKRYILYKNIEVDWLYMGNNLSHCYDKGPLDYQKHFALTLIFIAEMFYSWYMLNIR